MEVTASFLQFEYWRKFWCIPAHSLVTFFFSKFVVWIVLSLSLMSNYSTPFPRYRFQYSNTNRCISHSFYGSALVSELAACSSFHVVGVHRLYQSSHIYLCPWSQRCIFSRSLARKRLLRKCAWVFPVWSEDLLWPWYFGRYFGSGCAEPHEIKVCIWAVGVKVSTSVWGK